MISLIHRLVGQTLSIGGVFNQSFVYFAYTKRGGEI